MALPCSSCWEPRFWVRFCQGVVLEVSWKQSSMMMGFRKTGGYAMEGRLKKSHLWRPALVLLIIWCIEACRKPSSGTGKWPALEMDTCIRITGISVRHGASDHFVRSVRQSPVSQPPQLCAQSRQSQHLQAVMSKSDCSRSTSIRTENPASRDADGPPGDESGRYLCRTGSSVHNVITRIVLYTLCKA